MRLHRFFVEQPLPAQGTVRVADEGLVHQWRKVFRFVSGDSVILFDGSGFEWVATIADFGKDFADLKLGDKKVGVSPCRDSWLCLSIIKKDNFEWAVEKATELGVSHVVPVISGRTEKKSLNMDRLRIIVKEASEQSGRATVPVIHEAVSLADSFAVLKEAAVQDIYVADTESGSVAAALPKEGPIAMYVGPEGGWDDADKKAFAGEGVAAFSLGKLVLRAETAAIIAVDRMML